MINKLANAHRYCNKSQIMISMQFFLILIVSSFTLVFTTDITPCEGIPKPQNVRLEGCTTQPCQLPRGQKAKMEIDFIPGRDDNVLTPEVVATATGMNTNFPLPEMDACEDLISGQCPYKSNDKLSYSIEMPVLKIYPKIPLNIKFTLYDSKKAPITCFNVHCSVV